jgi:hypothetical protein
MRKLNHLLVFVLVVGLVLTSVHIISAQMQQGGRQRGTGQQQRRQRDPEEMLNRMLERTMGQLNLSEEETAVLQPMIKGLLEERMNQSTKRRELINAMREAIDAKNSEQVQANLKEIKDLLKKHKEKTGKMEKELVELLTVAQEAQLTVSGVVNSDSSGFQFGGGFRRMPGGAPGGAPGGMQRGDRPGGGG